MFSYFNLKLLQPGSGLRFRLFLLIIVTLSPLLLIRIWDISRDSRYDWNDAYRHVQDLSRVISDDHDDLIVKARTLLDVIAHIPVIQEAHPRECHRMLSDIGLNATWQTGLWVVNTSGTVLCGSMSEKIDLNIADRPYFKRALESKSFVVSDYVRTRLRSRSALIAALPALDKDGNVTSMVMATLDMSTLQQPLQSLSGQRYAMLLVDRYGVGMGWQAPVTGASAPGENSLGQDLSRLPLVSAMLKGEGGIIHAKGLDGIDRLWAAVPVQTSGTFVAVGVPEGDMLIRARIALRDSIIISVGIAIVAALLAWFGGEFFLVRHIMALAAVADKIGRGEVVGTVQLPKSAGELNVVARALSDMSKRLHAHDAEIARKSVLLEGTLNNMDQGLLMFDKDDQIQVWNNRALELLGLTDEVVRACKTLSELRRYQLSKGEFSSAPQELQAWIRAGADGECTSYERERPNGTVLEVRTVPFSDGGGVRTFTDVTERKRSEQHIALMARQDALTRLPNRFHLHERLSQSLSMMRRDKRPVAVLCMDLDRFKMVNDTLGHPVGDLLLVAVAERIRSQVREEDIVARLGGDEFAVIQIGDVIQPAAADVLASRLIAEIGKPYILGENTVNVGASIGIALAPQNGDDADELFKNADLALYKAKSDGRNIYRFFEQGMDSAMRARRVLEADLREAILREDFELHYQPVVDITRDEIIGFEALLRWRHPERGLILPSTFIPLAEEARLIGTIGEWVLRKACMEAMTWPGHLRVAVNVSAVQLSNRTFVMRVISALADSGLPPQRLELEITETALIEEDGILLEMLSQLRELGVRIAMDDFGTGYSSLGYVRRFTFDKIKIDRSFIQDIGMDDAAAIIRAVVHMCDRLGISVTAEGVETREQLDLVRQEGCTEVQGYYYSSPVPARDVLDLLARPTRADARRAA